MTPVDPNDAQAVAEFCAAAMWADDHASRTLGMTIDRIAPGTAELSMTVTPAMTNGHGTAHGGYIFALADSAFAFACNSRGPRAVAAQCQVAYLRPGRPGDRLVATAVEVVREGRSSIYDVHVRCEGAVVAEFRGHARQIGGSWLDGVPAPD